MNYAYSPHTGEFINVATPSDWMESTPIAPPAFDPQNAGCFFQNGAWVIVSSLPKALADAQETQLALMESSYQAANQADIAYMNTTFQADKASTDLMTSALSILSASLGSNGVGWYDKNNNDVAMTNPQFAGLCASIFARGNSLFVHKQTQKALIRAASNVASVQAITW
jgi:hypothetical protein